MREDKRHPADKQDGPLFCIDCGRKAALTIFRNEGICHGCRVKRDVAAVQRVASALPPQIESKARPTPSLREQALQIAEAFEIPAELLGDEVVIPREHVIYCTKCMRHIVAEEGQTCPYCNQ